VVTPTPSFRRAWRAAGALLAAAALGGCATRSADVRPAPTDPAAFATWGCDRIDAELDRVQQRAADVAYAVDERAGNNILALGVGVTVFWPALLALRPEGLDAAELGQLRGRFEALRVAAVARGCVLDPQTPGAARVAALAVALGERLVYEDRADPRRAPTPWVLTVTAVRRGEIEYRLDSPAGATWRHDLAGNVLAGPPGMLAWPRLLRGEMELGQLVSGEMLLAGDPQLRARVRGQVVAVGQHAVGARRFDAAVVELFGDATSGDTFTRLDGAMVVDRHSGVLLRLDLRSAQPAFALQRRLMRVEPGQP
jgi:hypothetical protein